MFVLFICGLGVFCVGVFGVGVFGVGVFDKVFVFYVVKNTNTKNTTKHCICFFIYKKTPTLTGRPRQEIEQVVVLLRENY